MHQQLYRLDHLSGQLMGRTIALVLWLISSIFIVLSLQENIFHGIDSEREHINKELLREREHFTNELLRRFDETDSAENVFFHCEEVLMSCTTLDEILTVLFDRFQQFV